MELTRTIDSFPKTNQMKEIIVREAIDIGDDYKLLEFLIISRKI